MGDFEKQLRNYRLTTAEILYHMPDHPTLLQSYIWQELDLHPDFPTLMRFLDYWEHHLDGKLHSVVIASAKLIQPSEVRHFDQGFYLH
jgi:uncharacterized protein Usg